MVHSVFELGDTIVREVMVPRTDLVCIERYKTIRQALTLALRSGFSRIPVIGENEDDVVGIVYLKDLARRAHINREAENDPVSTLMRPASFVPDTKNAGDLLREMQRDAQPRRGRDRRVRRHRRHWSPSRTSWRRSSARSPTSTTGNCRRSRSWATAASGSPPASTSATSASCTACELDDEDVETVGGLLAKSLGRVPIPGASAVVALPEDGAGPSARDVPAALRLTAESPAGRRNRIGTVLVAPVPEAEPDDKDE